MDDLQKQINITNAEILENLSKIREAHSEQINILSKICDNLQKQIDLIKGVSNDGK